MAISDWPIAERPRERLLAKGASILSDAELLAVLLRTGLRGKSAVELAGELLKQLKGPRGLSSAGGGLGKVKGPGDAKRAHSPPAIEPARRSIEEKLQSGAALTSPGAVRFCRAGRYATARQG